MLKLMRFKREKNIDFIPKEINQKFLSKYRIKIRTYRKNIIFIAYL